MPAQFEADPDNVFSMAFGLSINQKKIKKMEKEYKTMKSKENEDEVEIRVSSFNSFFFSFIYKHFSTFNPMMMPSASEARLDFFASEWTLLRLSAALWRTPCFKGRCCSRRR